MDLKLGIDREQQYFAAMVRLGGSVKIHAKL
jgi:hypothetical protein